MATTAAAGAQKQTTNTIVGCFALVVVSSCILFVIYALFLQQPAVPQKGELINLSYGELRSQENNLTDTQFESYEETIKGKRVRWVGYVADVSEDITGDNNVWVDMTAPSDDDHDVFFEYPKDASLKLNKNKKNIFEGDYRGITLGAVYLEDAEILNP